MKKIPSNVPVFIQDLESQENGRYSTAKLKVFYQGETSDHRLFTKEFSDKVIETLPSTPVVGFYSEEDKDFKGHNEIQYVYGHVPETASIEYIKDEESGNTFVVTDVILYTERKDNIGEIAKKIVGKQHSLELDPDTLKYKVNRDNQGRFLNIEFLSGQFIGLSVLGDNETPAFTGSCFFTTNEDFKSFASKCHDNFDKFLQFLNKNGGEIRVFNSAEFFSKTAEFLAKTMQEYQEDIYSALDAMGICGWICENTTEYAVIFQYNSVTDKCEYLKYSIVEDNGNLSLTNPVPVKARFLTEEQLQLLDSNQDSFVAEPDDKDDKEDDLDSVDPGDDSDDPDDDKNKDDEDFVKNDEEKKGACAKDDEDKKGACATDDEVDKKTNCVSGAEEDDKKGVTDNATDPQDPEKEDKEEEQVGAATASISSTSLSSEERTELEEYRRAAKIAVIDSYAADLDENILNIYRSKVDEMSKDELEAQLAIEFRKFIKSNNNTPMFKGASTFAIITDAADYNENEPADVIKKYNR